MITNLKVTIICDELKEEIKCAIIWVKVGNSLESSVSGTSRILCLVRRVLHYKRKMECAIMNWIMVGNNFFGEIGQRQFTHFVCGAPRSPL